MKPALVTGASGFVGWHVARTLLESRIPVRALARSTSNLRDLDVERVAGDLRDPQSLRRAIDGCGLLFHVAADYRLWARYPDELYQSNVQGTANILQVAKEAGVERVVYTSTVGTIGFQPGREADESSIADIKDMCGPYKRSKFLAEQTAVVAAQQGLPLVIVNPTAPVGDHDFKPTPTGQMIVDFLTGRMPAYIDTGLNLVDVRDVARGHLLAMEKGTPGERYILGNRNLRLKQILDLLSSLTGKPAPRKKLPYSVAYLAGAVTTGWANLSGQPPRVPLDAVRMARQHMFVSSAKAQNHLGWNPQPVEGALERAVDWFRSNGYC